jgi:D-alanyl-D-alanine carboxypeptidase/D-alanyl-D-alanine-endopeptidase (penicillin-binding protein 4)
VNNATPLIVLTFLLSTVIWNGCTTSRHNFKGGAKSIAQVWDSLGIADEHHTGLSIYDPEKQKMIFDYQGSLAFTPASNTKILTLYAAQHYLSDSIAAAFYQITQDTLFVWGGGDPGIRYPDIHEESPFIQFLKSREESIIFSNHHFQTTRFGEGWMWDDYAFGYQTERNAYPVYGNQVWVERQGKKFTVLPAYFRLIITDKKNQVTYLERNEWGSGFTYHYKPADSISTVHTAASLYENDVRFIWEELTGQDILFLHKPLPRGTQVFFESNRDSLIRYMMLESDNHIAEQLLLAAALKQTGVMSEKPFIEQVLSGPLAVISESTVWVDGSGLSRYNAVSPHSMIHVLDRIRKEKGMNYVERVFPAAGRTGTLKDKFSSSGLESSIFAKTGRMRNIYCMSGYLKTQKGTTLIFSWMNNHYNDQPEKLEKKMEKLFSFLRMHY